VINVRTVSLISLLFFFLSGCATQYKEIVINPIDQYQYKNIQEEIKIAVKPFDTDESCKENFGFPYSRYAIYPVLIVFENNSKEGVLLRRNQLELSFDDKLIKPSDPLNVYNDTKAREANAAVGGWCIGGPICGLLALGAADEANTGKLENIQLKGLSEEKIILPGETISGVLYFKILSKMDSIIHPELAIPIYNLLSGGKTTSNIDLTMNIQKNISGRPIKAYRPS